MIWTNCGTGQIDLKCVITKYSKANKGQFGTGCDKHC